MAMLSLGFAPSFLGRAAAAAQARRKLLIAIFQRGAVDGLNMVVPYGDAGYYAARPSIAIARPGTDGGAVNLDGYFGLHPRLAALQPFWAQKTLAVVHACGSHDATRSHFDAQDYMESGTPGIKSTPDGWLNRLLQTAPDPSRSPLRGVALTRAMPRSLQGGASSLAIGRLDDFTVRGQAGTSFEAAYADASDQVLTGSAGDAFEAMRALERTTRSSTRAASAHRADYPRSPFGQALQEIARLAKADVGLEIAFAETGQWDHHVNEGGASGQLANRLADFGAGIAALAHDLEDRMADTLILTMSEFGRSVVENGSRGTDHGHGNAMLVLGGGVAGGEVYGRWPGLGVNDRYEGRDLAVTTDFRDLFGEIVVRHLRADTGRAERVFPGFKISAERFPGVLRT